MATLSLEVRAHRYPAVGAASARPTLADIRLEVASGERVAVIGPSGCGKTTLLGIIAGLIPEFEGACALAPGTRLACVFQEPRLLPWRTVADNLDFVLGGAPGSAERIAGALREVELSDAANVYASRLSLGMARRTALARAFVVEPDLLLLDEPFVSLDQASARRLRLLLLDLLERRGVTAVLVTHDLAEAIMLADRLLLLSASPGRILGERAIRLTARERRDPQAVEAMRQRLIADDRRLGEPMAPSLEAVA